MSSLRVESMSVSPDTIEGAVDQEKTAHEPLEREASNKSDTIPPDPLVLHGFKLIALIASLMLALFCVAIDNTRFQASVADIVLVLTTAIPSITDSFHSYRNIGWYGAAYLITTSSCQILYARFYSYFHVRWVFLSALFLFEVGSLVCATAQNSIAFICGRAVAGLGSAGIFTGCFSIATTTTPVHLQPLVTGLLGGLFGVSAIFGPLLGGIFTQEATWRWCFYINLPIGAITTLGIILLLNVTQDLEKLDGRILSKILRFDPVGNTLLFGAVLCLLLALQWGVVPGSWSDGRVIALLTLFGVLTILMVVVEFYNRKNAMVPARIAKQRTVAFASFFAFCMGGSVFPIVFFLPIWFQGVKGLSAISSAVHTLPMILSQLTATISAGVLTGVIGYCMPFVYMSAILVPIGTGLFTTFTVDTPTAKWIGYQIILGLGVGCGFQQGNVAAASAVAVEDVPVAAALSFSSLFLGGAIFLNVAQNTFSKRLASNIAELAAELNLPNLSLAELAHVGATQIKDLVPPQYLPEALAAYNNAVTHTFLVSVIVSCLLSIGAAGMKWISLKHFIKRKNLDATKKQPVTSENA